MFQKIKTKLVSGATCAKNAIRRPGRMKALAMMLMVSAVALAQNTAGDYSAGTTALGTVTSEIAKYVPVVVKLCYAIAGVVAVVGAISVYIKMNNEEQDVKNILVLENGSIMRRKEMKVNALNINALCENLYFPMLARMTIKKT